MDPCARVSGSRDLHNYRGHSEHQAHDGDGGGRYRAGALRRWSPLGGGLMVCSSRLARLSRTLVGMLDHELMQRFEVQAVAPLEHTPS